MTFYGFPKFFPVLWGGAPQFSASVDNTTFGLIILDIVRNC